jgi:hypothetical protein
VGLDQWQPWAGDRQSPWVPGRVLLRRQATPELKDWLGHHLSTWMNQEPEEQKMAYGLDEQLFDWPTKKQKFRLNFLMMLAEPGRK